LSLSRNLRSAAAVVALTGCALGAATDEASYRASVEKWRQAYEAELRSDQGWLTVSGLFWLHEGANTFGSGAKRDIVLPASAPAEAGTFEFHAGKTVALIRAGVAATENGKPVQTVELHADAPSDQIAIGDLKLMVHQSGKRYAIRLRDLHSSLRKNFVGTRWFPIDPSYRIVAKWVPYDQPRVVQIQNVMGDTGSIEIPGYATFTLDGQPIKLLAEVDGNDFEVIFRDATSGHETYGAARFLDSEAPRNGTVVLDFNEAYNPPCAYNPYTTCPLPLSENRLKVPIEAGEKKYAGRSTH
jgi:uncharacterized protein (DUF1684 family)